MRTIQDTFQDLAIAEPAYGAILVFELIPLLSRLEIGALAATRRVRLSRPGTSCSFTAFGTWDPAWPRHASERREVGANSYRGPKGEIRTPLEAGEQTRFFPDFEVIHSWEGLGFEHRHEDGPIEQHGLAGAILRR